MRSGTHCFCCSERHTCVTVFSVVLAAAWCRTSDKSPGWVTSRATYNTTVDLHDVQSIPYLFFVCFGTSKTLVRTGVIH